MWNPLSGMTKTAIAVTLAGGVLVSGIAWQGASSITAIKKNLDNMKNEFQQAVSDKDYIADKFSDLKQLYTSAVSEANNKIDSLTSQRDELQAKIVSLEKQLDAKDDTDASNKDALQAEINRLEGELDKANQQIADLEAYAKQTDDSTTYKPIDKTKYDTSPQNIKQVGYVEIDDKAQSYKYAGIFAQQKYVKGIEKDFADHGITVHILGVTVVNTQMNGYQLAYVADNFKQFTGLSENVNALLTETGLSKVYFADSNGNMLGYLPFYK
ncbi:UNVERIFIED_ORG: peptidoglycan hydrolase CwlO-like protein [Heyndrickxia coagulans]